MAEQLQETVDSLRWNNYTSVAAFTLMSYDYLLLLEKEVKYVWKRQWSMMSGLYLIVRYLGLFLAVIVGCLVGGGLLYIPKSSHSYLASLHNIRAIKTPAICLPGAFSVDEVATPTAKYCTFSFNMGPMPAIYTSIPIICYDISLVVLASVALMKHLKERRDVKMRPNTYVLLIVRYHIIYFVLNLTSQVLLTILWANVPMPVMSLSQLFNDTAPFILAPRLIISIWDTHAHDTCVHVSTTFADCSKSSLKSRKNVHELSCICLGGNPGCTPDLEGLVAELSPGSSTYRAVTLVFSIDRLCCHIILAFVFVRS
ncbi:hypothetical protein K503DRAFT_785251 [Rhizopogon vinicolor AM-OR11-026]|uniref:DUF6533 domain-containing protein n=1 Tax=Rhizopogon vinicolor AM-OR11-026 TaxID=1314800 RepID=A0A1B7MRF2_9AGAM|nr:hypothetical protein K503DRAFT_785251 [Rhizopogon vinicolor AM-OR11-026]